MKKKLVFFAFTILTASAMRSQDTTAINGQPQRGGISVAGDISLLKALEGRYIGRGDIPVTPGNGQEKPSTTTTQPQRGGISVAIKDLRPITFPAWMVKKIAVDLAEKEHLETQEKVNNLLLAKMKDQQKNLLAQSLLKDLQIKLLKKNNEILHTRLNMKKEKKPSSISSTKSSLD